MARRPCYQCDDDLDEIRDRRNAEIRAWGKQQLADADAALLKEPSDNNHWTAWDQEPSPEPEDAIAPEPEPELTLSEVIPVLEVVAEEPAVETPKVPKTPKGAKPATS